MSRPAQRPPTEDRGHVHPGPRECEQLGPAGGQNPPYISVPHNPAGPGQDPGFSPAPPRTLTEPLTMDQGSISGPSPASVGQGSILRISFNLNYFMSPHTATLGTSLAAQWVRLCAPNAGGLQSIPGQGTRSHTPQLRPSSAKINK